MLAFVAVAWHAASSAAAENPKEEILKVDEERNVALQNGDVATLDRLYSDDLVYANASGASLTKAQHLADLKARTLHFISFKHEDVQAVVHGDTGMVSGTSFPRSTGTGWSSATSRRISRTRSSWRSNKCHSNMWHSDSSLCGFCDSKK
jgi:ketosteroid isomerase-like protein